MKAIGVLLAFALLAGPGSCEKRSVSRRSKRPDWRQEQECSQERLINYLFSPKRYSPLVRPNVGKTPVVVEHRYELLRLVDLAFGDEGPDGNSRILCLDVWDEWTWTDPRLTWSATKCEVEPILVPRDMVWVPDLQNDFGAAASPDKVEHNMVEVASDGEVFLSSHRLIKVFCDPIVVDGVNITSPGDLICGDEFQCTFQVASWNFYDTQLLLEAVAVRPAPDD